MAGNEYQAVRPKAHTSADGVLLRPRIVAGSPLAVQGIFLEALREYFSDPDAPFQWNTDANTTDLLIEAGENPQLEANNPSRGVFVVREGSIPASVMLGDRMGTDLPSGQEGFYAHMTTSFRVDCVSAAKGECEVLGDFVQHFLIASRRIIETQYGLYSMSLTSMGPVTPYTTDTEYYRVSLAFTVVHPFRWTTVRIAPLLVQMELRMLARTGHSPAPGSAAETAEAPADAAWAESAFESLSRNMPQIPDRNPVPDRT